MDVDTDKKRKSKTSTAKQEQELRRLEKLVFGDTSKIFNDDTDEPAVKKKKKKSKKLRTSVSDALSENEKDIKTLKPAWIDEDDINTSIQTAHTLQGRPDNKHPLQPDDTYSSLLKRKFDDTIGSAKWAELNREVDNSDDDDDDEILRHCGNFITKSNKLLSGFIKINSLKDLNDETKCEGKVIKAVEFHPKSTVALVAGLSGIVSLVEVNGKNNSKLQTVKFSKFDIRCAKFSQDGEQFIVGSSRNRVFYTYDMMSGRSILIPVHHQTGITNMQKFEVSPDGKFIASCGRFGNIFLLSAKTKEWLGSLNMNSEVRSISFSSDGSRLYSHGDEGKVYVWDMNSRQCIHIFHDEGCLKGTSICISPDNKLLACGSGSGVVNVYDTSTILSSEDPKPLKVLLNLTTSISSLKFNHSSEILAMTSEKTNAALRLMHYPSLTVYKNFPDQNKFNGLVNCINFSPRSGYLAVGNNVSRALLYRLNHFGDY